MEQIDDYINRAGRLVPAPHILPELMPLLRQPDVDNRKIVDLISYDTSLTASVLRVCNGAIYTRGTPIDNLLSAVTRLGSREIYQIVVLTVATTLAADQPSYGVEASDLWQHSVATAVAAQLIAREVREDENVVFTAGILHDVGKIILSVAMQNRRNEFAQAIERGASLIDAEEELLGCNHAGVGGRLLERWNLPACLIVAVANHHQPCSATEHQRLTACVHLGNSIAYLMGCGYGDPTLPMAMLGGTLKMLHISNDRLPVYLKECFERLEQIKGLYNLKN